MSENTKRFKNFRNELTESEYREVLTGYPNRDIHCDGPVRFDDAMVARVNAMLNAISRSTFMHPGEAFIKIKTRLNILMLDFPWTPYLWQDGGVGVVTLTVTRYGRVDGVDAITNAIRTDGKANNMDGFKQFTLVANIERAEDGFFRVSAKLQPMDIAVVEEDFQTPGEQIDELLTPMRDKITSREIDKGLSDTSNPKLSDAQRKKAYARATRAQFARLRARSHDGTKYGASHTAKYKKENERWRKKEKSVKEEVEQVEEGIMGKIAKKVQRAKQAVTMQTGSDPVHPQDRLERLHSQRAGKNAARAWRKKQNMKEAAGQEATAKKVVDNAKKIKKYEAKSMKEDAQQIAEAGAAKAARLAKAKERAGVQGDSDKFERASAVQKRIIARLRKKKGRVGAVSEELIGGQKKLDVNKNKRLDSQDFAMLRAKKKPMKEYLDMASGMALQSPAPGDAIADKSGKGKRFHKKAVKSVSEAARKPAAKPMKSKQKIDPGARNVIGQQKAIKKRLDQYGSSW